MSFAKGYLAKQSELLKLPTEPSPNLGVCIVIPCFNEPNLVATLDALWKCTRPACVVEVIVVLNSGENATPEQLERNEQTAVEFDAWNAQHQEEGLRFYCLKVTNVRHKFAGVGNARKQGMDVAAARFNTLNQPHGAIVGFDADSNCLPNYLLELTVFHKTETLEGVSVFYEHPMEGTEFSADVYERITQYELHLRYFVLAQQWAGLPFAHHTVGSSFAVSALAYVKYSGMNKRKAGEDFYFLQKVIPHGKYGTLYNTSVLPSPRPSDRVPFGTGATIQKMNAEEELRYDTYALKSFVGLKELNAKRGLFFKKELQDVNKSEFVDSIWQFMAENGFADELVKINRHSPNEGIFNDRFYQWWSAFRVIKYLNWAHENYFKRTDVLVEIQELLKWGKLDTTAKTAKEVLTFVRDFERNGGTLLGVK